MLQGSRACFLRDIPFSAIYFPVYANMKKFTADKDGYNNMYTLLFSATIAGNYLSFFNDVDYIFFSSEFALFSYHVVTVCYLPSAMLNSVTYYNDRCSCRVTDNSGGRDQDQIAGGCSQGSDNVLGIARLCQKDSA